MSLILLYCYILAQLLIVSYFDLRYRKISNFWSLINIIQFIVFLFVFSSIYHFNLETFYFPFVFFVVSFVLFALRIMGAGDSKYISTFYLCVPALAHGQLLVIQLYLTIAVGVFMLLMNTIKNFGIVKTALIVRDFSIIRNVYGKKFAYAPVLLLSWIIWGIIYGVKWIET